MAVPPEAEWIQADFNGLLERTLLCLAHKDVVTNQAGRSVALHAGLQLTAFDLDSDDEGRPDNLLASGTVEVSPPAAQCRGSRWALRIDAHGIRSQSELERPDK
jgi:hypothetical protein